MFSRRTLFVIGAGASCEVGLPVGTGLATSITDRLHLGDRDYNVPPAEPRLISQLRRAHPQQANEVSAACNRIREGVILSKSIDDFLHIHRENPHVVAVGKATIVNAILAAEAQSSLYVNQSNSYNIPDYRKFADTWFVKFMRVLGEKTSDSDAPHLFDNVSFIVFNYDRCLEHFLRFALRHLYSLSATRAAEIVDKANIIHPYGVVGALDETPFGGSVYDHPDYVLLSQRIKLYTEQIDESDTVERMRQEVASAERIVFLGFAFHPQNMTLMKPKKPLNKRQVFATAVGMSDDDAGDVSALLSEWFPGESYGGGLTIRSDDHIRVENKLKCADLFDYYARSIAR